MILTPSLKPVLPADVERWFEQTAAEGGERVLAEPYALDREQIEHYRERGLVKLGHVTSGGALRYFRDRADANRISAMREAMTVAYMSADAVYD